MEKILRIIGLALCFATFASGSYNSLNPETANNTLSIILLFSALITLIVYLIVTKGSERGYSEWKLFGSKTSFWVGFLFLIVGLAFIIVSTFVWDFSVLPFILCHFSVLAILYFGNSYYCKTNTGKKQIQ